MLWGVFMSYEGKKSKEIKDKEREGKDLEGFC